jgi:hypothetical protein
MLSVVNLRHFYTASARGKNFDDATKKFKFNAQLKLFYLQFYCILYSIQKIVDSYVNRKSDRLSQVQ